MVLRGGPVSLFKTLSMTFGGSGLIFEGLERSSGRRNSKFRQGLPGVSPQRSDQGMLLRNFFWDRLFQKKTGTASTGVLAERLLGDRVVFLYKELNS
jgi:hypothetical protein